MSRIVLTAKQQLAVTALAIAGILTLLTVCLLDWNAHSETARKEQTRLEQKIQTRRSLLEQKPDLLQQLHQSITHLHALEKNLPPLPDRYAWAYEYISLRAQQAEITINRLEEVTSNADNNPFETIIFVECDSPSLIAFIRQLEENSPLLRIKKINITSPLGNSQLQQIQIRVQWPPAVQIKGEAA